MRSIALILFYILSAPLFVQTYGQNLVRNPSFESYHSCPTSFGQAEEIKDWYIVRPSVDYYACSVGIPTSIYGTQLPRTGGAHMGFYTSEMIASQLIQPLEAGKQYYIEFYTVLGDGRKPITNVGMHLSSDSICEHADLGNVQVLNTSGPITDTVNWTQVSSVYTASGCEEYITFIIDDTTGTYYYFDDVSITCIDSQGCNPPTCAHFDYIDVPNVFTPNNDLINDVFTVDIGNFEPIDFRCSIYNRWGQRIAQIDYPGISWDGKVDGEDAPTGVYYYILSIIKTPCGPWLNERGFVHLFR